MYSLVFMAAMATAPEAEGFGGSWYNTCTLDSCHPIRYGWKPYGCVLHTPIHIPYGCCGGCYGCYGSCHGCYGGCYGSWGHGSGCYGYGLGYWYDAASAGPGYSGFGGFGNFGHFGAYSLYPSGAATLNLVQPQTVVVPEGKLSLGITPGSGAIVGSSPTIIAPGYSTSPMLGTPSSAPQGGSSNSQPMNFDSPAPRKESRELRNSTDMTTANIVVDVPENATVYIDGNKMKAGSGRRVFSTPPIQKGEEYFYTVRVVLDENGKKIEDSQRVTVRGGEETSASFAHLKRTGPALVGR